MNSPDARIFVFGSNLAGRHGAGAAKTAYEIYGAVYGKGKGLHGRSYAIPTKDKELRVLPLEQIEKYVREFLVVARIRTDLEFNVTRVGCGLAGYKNHQIAPMFKYAPPNCFLPVEWQVYAGKDRY
jgi:hypothetical protein